jgi:PII-like signaling protein
MQSVTEAELLRVFVGERDQHHGRPLYEVILEEARQRGLAGGTALRGSAGFGVHHLMHTAKILALSEDLPMVVEIIDASEKITSFVSHLEGLLGSGLATVEKVRVINFGGKE